VVAAMHDYHMPMASCTLGSPSADFQTRVISVHSRRTKASKSRRSATPSPDAPSVTFAPNLSTQRQWPGRSQSVMERSQWTGRGLTGRHWEEAFRDLLRRLHAQDPSLQRVCCSDVPDGSRLVPHGTMPESKLDPIETPTEDTRDAAWQLVYGGSSGADVEELAGALKGNLWVQEIDLAFCNLGNDALAVLVQGFEPQLTKVQLSGNKLRSKGGSAVAQGIGACHHLLSLDLDFNLLGECGARMLSQGLQYCTYLEEFSLARNGIGPTGTAVVCEALSHCPRLQTLNFYYNAMKDHGAHEVAQLLRGLRELKVLRLGGNRISDAGASQVCAAAVKTCHQLEVLDLRWNCIKAAGARGIAKALTSIPSLRELQLECNLVPLEGSEAIKQALLDSAPSLIPKFGTLSPARKTLARISAMEKRSIHMRSNKVGHKSCTELIQFEHERDTKYQPKRSFMPERGVQRLPMIGSPDPGFLGPSCI